MTLAEIKTRLENIGLQYAYQKFKKKVNPPHLIGHIINTDNFAADNVVYRKINNFQLELTTNGEVKETDKTLQDLQKEIEEKVLFDVYWDKTENYIPEEEVYNTSYFFIIKEEI